MKTKTLLYILLSVLVLSFASCTDDDKIDYINHYELPEKAQTFLSEYLPNNKFITASVDDYFGGNYFVQLEEEIEVLFTSKGDWSIVQSKKGLPETVKSLLSDNSRKELNEKYPTAKIRALQKYMYDELHIELDNNKAFIDMYSHEGDVLAEMLFGESINVLPDKMKEFMTQYFHINTRTSPIENQTPLVLKFSGFKGTIYRYRITPIVFVDFYEDGEWFYMKESEKENTVKDKFIKAIPAEVIATLKKEEPNAIASIKQITRFDDNKDYGFNKLYGFDFGDNQFILINSENKVVKPPLEKAKEFINAGFNPKNELQYNINANTTGPYFLRYAFKVTGPTEDITLVMDVNGNMRNIWAGPITTEVGKTVALPRAVLEMLHEDIVSYIDTNYPEKDFISIFHSYSEIGDTPAEVNLVTPIPNNLTTLIFDTKSGEFIREYNTIGEKE